MSNIFSGYDIYDRSRLTLHCVFTLQSPLSHIGEVSGNVSNLKTVKLLDLEGQSRQCFVYSGNAIRNGILRRVGVAAALTDLELSINPDVHQTMFAGGRIDGSTASDMELDKKIRQFMPWLSVLGTAKPTKVFGSKDAQMVQGRINIGSAHLICYESAAYIYNQMPGMLPPEALEGIGKILEAQKAIASDPMRLPSQEAIASYNEAKAQYLPLLRKVLRTWTEFITVDQTTRRDSLLDPNLIKFLPPEAQNLLKGEGGKEKKSDQMISGDRLIMAGAKLYSRWDLNTTNVETGFIVDTLLKFANNPYIGGKNQRGLGLVDLQIWFKTPDGQKAQSAVLGSPQEEQLCKRGHFLGISLGEQILSDVATEKHSKYQEYLSIYKQFLAESKESPELRILLGTL